MDGFTLNGFRSDTDLGIIMGQVVKPIAPSMSPVTEDVPAKYGVHYEGTNYQAKTITISYTVMNYESQDDFNRAIQNLAAKLIRPELGSQEYALVFDDEPDKTYMGHVSAIDAPNFISIGAYDFSGNITFEMSDPRAYLPLEKLNNKVNQSDNLLINTTNSVQTAQATGWGDAMQYYTANGEVIPAGSKVTGQAWLAPTGRDFGLNILGLDSENNLVWLSDTSVSSQNVLAGKSGYAQMIATVPTDLHHVELYSNLVQQISAATSISWKEAKLCVWSDANTAPDMNWSPADGEAGFLKDSTNGMSVAVDGTAEADPVISIIPKRDLNHAGFVLNGGNFGVGTDDDVQQPNVQSPYTSIVEDNAGSISEWSNDASAISSITTASNFVAQSSMAASTDGSSVLNVARNKDNTFNFGSLQQSKWYGPLYRYQGISASLPYYKISAMLHHKIYDGIHNLRAMGDIEFLLLDGNGRSFGRFAIKSQSGGHVPYALMQIGTSGSSFSNDSDHHTLYNGKGVNFTDKKNIKVRLPTTIKTGKKKRIKYITVVNAENTSALTDAWLEFTLEHTLKNGVPVFNWSIIQYNLKTGLPYKDKRQHLIVSGQFVDNGNKFSSSLGSVGLGMWKMAITEDTTNPAIPYRNCYMSLTGLSIYQVNQQQLEPTKPKQIATAGQELILDCANDRATVDGHEISPTWTTNFPKLVPGFNELVLDGDIADADIVLSYYPRTY